MNYQETDDLARVGAIDRQCAETGLLHIGRVRKLLFKGISQHFRRTEIISRDFAIAQLHASLSFHWHYPLLDDTA